jgi:hypothetical protein
MRAMDLMVPMMILVATPLSSQMPQSPCPSGVVRWQIAGHFVEGDLTEIPEAGRPLKVRQAGFGGTRDLPVTSDGLACRVSSGGKGKGALVGAAIGVGAGALLGFASGDDTCNGGWCF